MLGNENEKSRLIKSSLKQTQCASELHSVKGRNANGGEDVSGSKQTAEG